MYKLLVVDDNNMHINCVLDYADWEAMGFDEIRTASNGKEGLEVFMDFLPDLVITDVVMPLSGGVELAEKIRKIDSRVHIIFMSCYEEFNYIKSAIDNDITAYILKPLDSDVLIATAEKVISSIEERNRAESSKQALDRLIPFVRESLLYRMVYSNSFSVSDEVLKSAKLSEVKCSLVIKYILSPQSSDYEVLYSVLESIFVHFARFSPCAITELPNKIIILLTDNSKDEEAFFSSAVDSARNHISMLREKSNICVSAGFSDIYPSLKYVHHMFTQASRALDGVYNIEENDIYLYEDFEESELDGFDYNIKDLKDDLSTLLIKADTSAIEDFLKKYYPRNSNPDKNTIKALCFSTVTTLQLLFAERNTDMGDLFENTDIIWQKLNKFETIQDTYHWLKNILLASCEFIVNKESSSKNDIVSAIKLYIDANYKDINTLSQIAAKLYISTGYARNLFKKTTGQTIFDYLTDTRINEAKRLLAEPQYKIYEIKDLVGYTNKAHFTETFKRKTGMTPNDYRKHILKQ